MLNLAVLTTKCQRRCLREGTRYNIQIPREQDKAARRAERKGAHFYCIYARITQLVECFLDVEEVVSSSLAVSTSPRAFSNRIALLQYKVSAMVMRNGKGNSFNAVVAQQVEHRSEEPSVGGSIPLCGTNKTYTAIHNDKQGKSPPQKGLASSTLALPDQGLCPILISYSYLRRYSRWRRDISGSRESENPA